MQDFRKRMARLRRAAGMTILLGWPSLAAAAGDQIPAMAKAFGTRADVLQASLSPDGTLVAVVQPQAKGQGNSLYVAAVQGKAPAKTILAGDGNPNRIGWCRWAGQRRLVCNVYGVIPATANLSYASRLLAVNADGTNMKPIWEKHGGGETLTSSLYGGTIIDWAAGGDGKVLMARNYIRERDIGTRLAQAREGLGVDVLDVQTGQTSIREPADKYGAEFVSDGQGEVRVMGRAVQESAEGYSSGLYRYHYRTQGSREWKVLADYNSVTRAGFNPVAVDREKNVVYGLKLLNGRVAAYSISLDGTLKETLLYASPDVDIDNFVTLGRNNHVVGVTFATDRRKVVYFDPEIERLHASLGKAIPQLPLIDFIDSSEDGTVLLLRASSDVNPGSYYVFDRKAKTLNEILVGYPRLEKVPLAPVKAISFRAADGTQIPGYLTLPLGSTGKGLPAIVMPHGGPSARDEWQFDWLAQYWANLGYAVLQPNFRGSAGYGNEWFQINGFQSWKTAIGDVNDAGRWLVSQGIANPAKLAILGWSYGGYAALQSAATTPDLFKAVVAIAPVTDLGRAKQEWMMFSNYRIVRDFIGEGPHVAEGSPARLADKFTVPVLMFHGTLDRNVSVEESRLMNGRLKEAGKSSELVIFDGLDHQLDDSEARTQMLDRSARFLAATLKLPVTQ